MTHSTKSSSKPIARSQLCFEALGTAWVIDYQVIDPLFNHDELAYQITQRLDTYELAYSRFRNDSWISRIAHQAGTYQLPADGQPLFDLYKSLYDATGGSVTPLIGQTLVDAGYDATYSLRQACQLQQPPSWDEVIDYNFPHLELKQPALLDVGAAGKGYAVDIVSELLESCGITSYCVDAGGDIRQRDTTALEVGLEHPTTTDNVIGIINLQNQSLCGSAGNRRAWGEFHHIINPHSLHSPTDILAVWVVAHSTLLADGLSTAIYFCDPHILQKRYTFEYARVRDDYSLEVSPGFPATFF